MHEKPLRIIYAIEFTLEGHASLLVTLTRSGQASAAPRTRDRKQGMPHPPKKRTIDLRIGDRVMFRDAWRKILAIRTLRDDWLSPEEAQGWTLSGYIYRPRRPR